MLSSYRRFHEADIQAKRLNGTLGSSDCTGIKSSVLRIVASFRVSESARETSRNSKEPVQIADQLFALPEI